jgi:glycosyltransferase involved in cell wall biosynthesis
MTRVAGILVNLVPYHHARWETFAQNAGVQCAVVELTKRDAFRALEFSSGARYHRNTLFPSDSPEAASGKALSRAMAAALDEFRPKVVCLSGYAFRVSLAALQWAVRRRIPVVVFSESNEFDQPRSPLKELIKRRMAGLCSAGLAGGTPQAHYLSKLGLPAHHVFIGYDVVDNRYFGDQAAETRNSKPELQTKYGLPKRYFLACCRFGEKKNLPRLIQAFGEYRKIAETPAGVGAKHKEGVWDLVLVGDGEQRAEIEATISRLGLAGAVHLAGARPYGDLPAYYALAGVFIHASTTEQWGLVVNEAMASGLPVLVSHRCGCAPDLVREGVNGFTFDPYNVPQLAQLMLQISAFQTSRLSAFGDASRAIISNWGPARFASGLQAAVDCALAVGPKKASLLDRLLLCALIAR